MTSDIANILSVQPPAVQAPAAQSQAQSSSQPSAQTDNQNTTQTAPQPSQNPQAQTNNSPAQTNNVTSNASDNDSHFGKLLAAKQQGSSAATPLTTKPATPKSTADQTDIGSNNGATLVFVLAQLPVQPVQSDASTAQNDETGAVGSAGTSQTSSNDSLLQQLQQLLQQALAASDALQADTGNTKTTGQAATPGTDTAGQATTANADTAGQAAAPSADTTGQPATSGANANTPLTQALSELIALLQDTASSSPATAADTTQITSGATAGQNTTPDTALIVQLAKALEDKLGSGQDATNTATAAATPVVADAGSNKPADNASNNQPGTGSDALLQSANAQNTILQSALSQIAGFLSSTHGSKPDAASIDPTATQPATANTLSANTTTPVIAPTTGNQPQATNNEFVKFLSAATSNVPVADQVLVQIRSAATQGTSQIKIQLEPADLGKVTVQMNTGTDGKTGVTITADNRQTLSMLQSEARSLESALRNIGLKTDTGGLNFNLSGQQQDQQNTGKQGGYTQVAATATEEDADYYSTVTGIYRLSAQQGLDIRV